MGFLAWAQIWVHAIHMEGGSDTNKLAQELTRRDIKIVPYPAPPPYLDLNSDSLTTELRHPQCVCMCVQYIKSQ